MAFLLSTITRPWSKVGYFGRFLLSHSIPLRINAEVKEALSRGGPVVALESTIISHGGMGFPKNIETAQRVESAVRSRGAIPATIAIMDGHLVVGCSNEEMARLGRNEDDTCTEKTQKCSVRDIPLALAAHSMGSTTVAATMRIAELAGIRIFATGGIGGVHRGASQTFDISADLTELGRTKVCVVCAGAKSILDLPKTLEFLETMGVPVLGYQTDEFPAFFQRSSGLKVIANCPDAESVARILVNAQRSSHKGGILLGVPVPVDVEADAKMIEDAIEVALKDADSQKIEGKNVTPFLLGKIRELTEGKSLEANIGLILNNAKVAGDVAVFLSRGEFFETDPCRSIQCNTHSKKKPEVIVLGASVVDVIAKTAAPLLPHSSNPGHVSVSPGGVGRNIAEALTRLGDSVLFVTNFNPSDPFGEILMKSPMGEIHLAQCSAGAEKSHSTDRVVVFEDSSSDLTLGVADISSLSKLTGDDLKEIQNDMSGAKIAVLDANCEPTLMRSFIEMAHKHGLLTIFEPTSTAKARKIVDTNAIPLCSIICPNEQELQALDMAIQGRYDLSAIRSSLCDDAVLECSGRLLKAGCKCVITKRGSHGIHILSRSRNVFYPAPQPNTPIVSTNGCGDTFLAGVIHSLLKDGTMESAAQFGLMVARYNLGAREAVSSTLNVLSCPSYEL
eukprot:TRINITY_DN810_c0_g1_i1.p1 TRINITY_DN810_c0_g1~~TRINITY_DN810_c0_g1_i1.p1  ORF type:complete len:676 (-),score=150.20 TRINITY_DN810_c0_g1_i1:1871-3898(-)